MKVSKLKEYGRQRTQNWNIEGLNLPNQNNSHNNKQKTKTKTVHWFN